MSKRPFISICIPAYKRVEYLSRLLHSIAEQEFQDFEVILTDDSPDPSVKQLADQFSSRFSLRYLKNEPALGTPENWNEGMRNARGEWIKLIHDDDWFSDSKSLGRYAAAAGSNPEALIIAPYTNVFLDEEREQTVFPENWRIRKIEKVPFALIARNCIGPPSVIMHRNDGKLFYDKATKWVVDIDFYIRRLPEERIVVLDQPAVKVGISKEQVTFSCVHHPEVEIPENLYLFDKAGWFQLQDILVYDFCWRLLRNLNIRKEEQIAAAGYKGKIPVIVSRMISSQALWPSFILRIGIFSKSLMLIHYFRNRKLIPA